jgi:hypothetical protein
MFEKDLIERIKEEVKGNFDDFCYLNNFNKQHGKIPEQNYFTAEEGRVSQKDKDAYFMSINSRDNSKPLWSSFTTSESESTFAKLVDVLPLSFKGDLSQKPALVYQGEFISVVFHPERSTLPTFTEKDKEGKTIDKSFKVPTYF